MAQDADALAHAGPVEVRRRGGDDLEVQQQVLGRNRVEVELPDRLTAEGDRRLKDRAGGDDGGNHHQRLAQLPGRYLAHVQRVAAADGQDDFSVRQAFDQRVQIVLAHAALELQRPRRMRQKRFRRGPGAGRSDGDVVRVPRPVFSQDAAAVAGVPGAAVEVDGVALRGSGAWA